MFVIVGQKKDETTRYQHARQAFVLKQFATIMKGKGGVPGFTSGPTFKSRTWRCGGHVVSAQSWAWKDMPACCIMSSHACCRGVMVLCCVCPAQRFVWRLTPAGGGLRLRHVWAARTNANKQKRGTQRANRGWQQAPFSMPSGAGSIE